MTKKILSILLSVFVVISIGYLIYGCFASPNETPTESPANTLKPNRIEVAYFIFGKRCATCHTIEKYSEEVVKTVYKEQSEKGDVVWNLVDCDKPENKHFLTDFSLVAKAVIVIRYENNEVRDYENLKEIWTRYKDKQDYFDYISEWVNMFIQASSDSPLTPDSTAGTDKPEKSTEDAEPAFWEKGMLFGLLFALWLGIMTSIAPCPLATNIAAISFIGKSVTSPKKVLISGLLYTLGRVIAYVGLALLLVSALLSDAQISQFFQDYMNKFLGPLLVLAGMFLVGLLSFSFSTSFGTQKMQNLAKKGNVLASVLIGIVFALSFCPVSAAIFFISFIPISLKYESGIILPTIYGIGTGLPVMVFAILVAFGAKKIAAAFNNITRFEKWSRLITGAIFILVGVYMSLQFVYKLF